MASAPEVLVRSDVCDLDPGRDSMSGWAILKCTSTNAVDKCDEALAKAVTLLVRADDTLPIASFGICLNRELHRIKSDVADNNPMAYVEAADDGLLVLSEQFQARKDSERLIVYDAAYTSLYVVPRLSRWYYAPSFTPRSFPLRSNDGSFALAIMVEYQLFDRKLQREVGQDALCLWPPPPSSKPLPQGSIAPWQLKEPVFPPEKPAYFSAHQTFSFQGRAFWADLGQGVLSCNCVDVLSGGYKVPFRYAELPPECLFGQDCEFKGTIDLSWSRAMSCCPSDGSIKLVCIGRGCGCHGCGGPVAPGDMVVAVWALDLSTWQWRRDSNCNELQVSSLWEMVDFKEAGLPQVEPIFPVLSGDFIIHFKLFKPKKDAPRLVHLCGLNLRTKTILQWSSVLSRSPTHPPIFASDFMQKLKHGNLLASATFPIPSKRGRVGEEQEDNVLSVHPLEPFDSQTHIDQLIGWMAE